MRKPLSGNAAYPCPVLIVLLGLLGGCSESGPALDAAKAAGIDNSAAIDAPACEPADCARIGGFTPPFAEPYIDPAGAAAPESPDINPLSSSPGDDRCLYGPDQRPIKCKPTAGSVAVLSDGRILYFNALEGTERVEYSIFFEAGHALQNDQSRVMTLAQRASWILPQPNDAGAENPDPETLPGVPNNEQSDLRDNDGALFCADLATVAGGRVLAVGGTDYYNEPGVDVPIPFGVSELEGLKNARIYDPKTNAWTQTGTMAHGRWYPSVVSLPSGDVLVASGVTKLVKPVYPDAPMQSGTNVRQSETWDLCSGQWTGNGAGAERSLPLYPRLHLLPDGQVLYNAAGQAFNPFGQAYDQPTWNLVAAYDPAAKAWTDLGYAGLPGAGTTDPQAVANLGLGAGFRGSTFSIMLPLVPDAAGHYGKAEFLTAGGVIGGVLLTSPGSNQPTAQSRIDTITINGTPGGAPTLPGLLGGTAALGYSSRATAPMNAARWYGTGVLLPTGDVLVFSGADRDEVQLPGSGMAIRTAERFDPATETWSPMATQHNPRTYHNTAVLLPDGRVLVGGHAPINTAYAWGITLPGFSPNDGRDPSFEIYSPPYVFGKRPSITSSGPKTLRPGEEFTITTHEAADVTAVVLVRRTDLTHLVDGDQRTVVLPITGRNAGKELRARMPAQRAVVPPGEYMLFIVAPGENGPAPSVSLPVTVPADRNC